MNEKRMKHYLPALIFFVLALFFMVFPGVAAFLVILGLLIFAFAYAAVIYRFHQFQDTHLRDTPAGSERPTGFEDYSGDIRDPSFSHVTVYMTRRGRQMGFKDFKF